MLATVGCSPRRTRSVTCALCFAVARAPAFVSGSAQGGSADTPSGPRFLFHGGDAACTPCKAPVCDAWTCRARSDSRCRPLCATRLPCPLGQCPAQQTSRDCAAPPPLKPSPEAWPQAERRANASWRQDSGAKPVTPHWSQQPKDAPPPRTVLRTSVHGFSIFNVHVSPLGGGPVKCSPRVRAPGRGPGSLRF